MRVIHLSTAPTTTTTSILFIILITMSISACLQTAMLPAPTQIISEPISGEVYEIPEPAIQCATVTAEQSLHLRAGPSETSQVIGWLKASQIVRVDLRVGEWWKIGAGYARADYLQETECR